MLSYELCLKLKEAGFPQETEFFHIPEFRDRPERPDTFEEVDGEWGEARSFSEMQSVAAPTLSELIEACGDVYWDVYKTSNSTKGTFFVAEVLFEGKVEEGSCPEEAVANLYLALKI